MQKYMFTNYDAIPRDKSVSSVLRSDFVQGSHLCKVIFSHLGSDFGRFHVAGRSLSRALWVVSRSRSKVTKIAFSWVGPRLHIVKGMLVVGSDVQP